ncbi:MAG: hypothetical protein JJU26_04420 [Oceanicaulis sp.]|uniref:hypothetical protein n=1 Tax=Glycocaulis sp. TaxID=1969725 RepID=UPI0025BBEE75|nr:hypothetical protein [Glycocaulis sp.]MCC5980943.1 hypothetical protein [Oceanicaulis sp.]MCH8520692.1 hypothetical protein [Glycocaulis sp.]
MSDKILNAPEAVLADLRDFGLTGSDVTSALQRAGAELGPDSTISLPAGEFIISAPVDLAGASLAGSGRHLTRLTASRETSAAEWCIGPDPNDVAMLYAVNRNGWRASGFSLDGCDRYTGGIVARGGSDIHFSGLHARNFANAPIQFMGSRRDGEWPVSRSSITRCISSGSRWCFVLDGEAHDIVIADNLSLDAVNRHISLDPREAVEERRVHSGVLVVNNVCSGQRALPDEWREDYSLNRADAAIRAKHDFRGLITGNTITGWGSVQGEGRIRGVQCDGGQPVIDRNLICGVPTAEKSRGVELGPDIAAGTIVHANTVTGFDIGLRADGALAQVPLVISNNVFAGVRTAFSNLPKPRPPHWSMTGNMMEGKPAR